MTADGLHDAPKQKHGNLFCRALCFGLVLSERFSAQTSPFCSALALRRGTSRRLGRFFCGLLHLSERSRTIEVRVTTLSAQNARKITRPILLGCVYRIDPLQAYIAVSMDRAACMWTSRHKNIRRRFAVGIFCRCSQLRRAYFAQGRVIDRAGQYPWVLASGGTMPLRKSRRLNLAHIRTARSQQIP